MRPEKEERRQRALLFVEKQPSINGFIILDDDSELLLEHLISVSNKHHSINIEGSVSSLPDIFNRASISFEFEKLELYAVISHYSFDIAGNWYVTLSNRGITYFEKKTEMLALREEDQKHPYSDKEYDVFISHASSDKLEYVDSLYSTIRRLGINVFYDTDVISWGDNWKDVLLRGTEKSEFAIIVISKNFFGREWTERELEEFLKRQNASGQKIILPLLYDVTIEEFRKKYPALCEIQAITTERFTKEEITILFAKELIKRLRNNS